MYGQGILKGLGITIRHFFGKAITQQYPEERPILPDRFHGFFTLDVSKCNACGNCERACPNHVIEVVSERDEANKRHTTAYIMHSAYCLFCGLCVEACNRDALHFTQEYELATSDRKQLKVDLVRRAVSGAADQ